MASWIDGCRDSLIDSMNALRTKYPKARFRVAFVGYRDHSDAERFVIHGLNEDVDATVSAIRKVTAEGGGDTPEDVAGGLWHATRLDWKGDTRLLLFCCDAPAHGDKYHEANMDDSYPKGCPEKRDPADLVRQLAQKRVDMTIFRVNRNVDKMCALFKVAHAEGAAAEGGAGEDANFVLLNVEQQVAAAGRRTVRPMEGGAAEGRRTIFHGGMAAARGARISSSRDEDYENAPSAAHREAFSTAYVTSAVRSINTSSARR